MPPSDRLCRSERRLIDARALALFLILFVWQFPHFYAIAWMYREDYARGGIRMLPVIEPDGESTARRVVACSLLLIPISLVPRLLGTTGSIYPVAAIVAGLVLLYYGVRLGRERSLVTARHVLLASVVYLPVLFGVMVLDRGGSKPSKPVVHFTRGPFWVFSLRLSLEKLEF